MIEAVNSAVANSSLLRGNAEQASVVRSFAANPDRVQEVIQAPYVSPFIFIDVNYDKAVLQIRDSDTGDVLKQFPSEATMEIRARQAAKQAAQTSVPDVQDDVPAPQPQANAQAQVAAAALASTQAQAAAVSAPPTSGNVVVTA